MFFQKKTTIVSPVTGEVIPLSNVKDEVFSTKMMGDGFAVIPQDDQIYAPVKGTITSVFPTKHAISIVTKNGREVLIHIGIETVDLKGSGFEVLVNEGQVVKENDLLVNINRDYLKENGKDDTVIILFPDTLKGKKIIIKHGELNHGQEIGNIE